MESKLQLLLKRVTAKEGFIHTVERKTPGTGRCFVDLDIYVSFGGRVRANFSPKHLDGQHESLWLLGL